MAAIGITALREDIYNIIAQVNESCEPMTITNARGKGAVLVGEDDWKDIEETLYLMSIPGMAEALDEAQGEPADECVPAHELGW